MKKIANEKLTAPTRKRRDRVSYESFVVQQTFILRFNPDSYGMLKIANFLKLQKVNESYSC